MQGIMPDEWAVVSVEETEQPHGWKRAAGGSGLAIKGHNAKIRIQDRLVGERHPTLTTFVLPLNWEGENREIEGQKLGKGGFTWKSDVPRTDRSYFARYLGHNKRNHIFSASVGHEGWKNPNVRIQRYFPLEVTNAYVVSTEITSISLYTYAGGHSVSYRTFEAGGWRRHGGMTGDPKRPRMGRVREPVTQGRLEQIWRATMALNKETLAKKEKPREDWKGYNKLVIRFSDDRETVLVWQNGKEPADTEARKLTGLISKNR